MNLYRAVPLVAVAAAVNVTGTLDVVGNVVSQWNDVSLAPETVLEDAAPDCAD